MSERRISVFRNIGSTLKEGVEGAGLLMEYVHSASGVSRKEKTIWSLAQLPPALVVGYGVVVQEPIPVVLGLVGLGILGAGEYARTMIGLVYSDTP